MDSTESTATDGQQTADLKEFEEKQSNDNFKWTRTTPSIIAVGLFFWIVALFWKSLLFRLIALTFTFVFSTYVCVIADPATSNISQFCTITLPSSTAQYLEQIIGKERVDQLSKFMDHIFQIIYLIIVLGCWSIVFNYGYPEIAKSNYVSSYHQRIGYIVFIMCIGSWHYACTTSPGRITATTIALFDHYEYDDVLYTNRLCPTLQIRKIARSKYDRSTQTHVPRFDHHCVWLNNAMGERNYRYFLLFLSIHVCMCLYGTYVVGAVMYGEILDKDLLNAIFYNAATGEEVKADYIVVFHYLFIRHFELSCVLLLMSVMGLMLGLFLGFHLYITSINMTTNEYFKWRSVKRWHKKERLKYESAMKVGLIVTTECNSELLSQQQVPDGDVGCVGTTEVDPPHVIADDAIFDPGPMPMNIYNKGLISNILEVLSPLSLRDVAILRYRAALQQQQKCIYEEIGMKQKTH